MTSYNQDSEISLLQFQGGLENFVTSNLPPFTVRVPGLLSLRGESYGFITRQKTLQFSSFMYTVLTIVILPNLFNKMICVY